MNAVGIILFVALLNVLIWVVCGIILVSRQSFVRGLSRGANASSSVVTYVSGTLQTPRRTH